MSPRLLRPIAGGFHPEAQAWRNAVIANNGTVSGSTLSAVSRFCRDIDAAGIRDRFYRLNLFCGTDLNACLVPLYRGPSPTGTQYGNATDTNNGPFVSGDYAESDGLSQAATTSNKYLSTGLTPDDLGPGTGHMSIYLRTFSQSASARRPLGSRDGTNRFYDWSVTQNSSNLVSFWGAANSVSAAIALGALLTQRESSVLFRRFTNGSLDATTTTSSATNANNLEFLVFNTNNSGVPITQQYFNESVGAYSFGAPLTTQGVADYYTALQSFQTALGRNV